MSKKKLGMILLLSSGYMTALGCSLFGPLRFSFNSIWTNITDALGS